MAKNSRRRHLVDKSKNAQDKRTVPNPFDAKFNREKESVLGKGPAKMVHGKPGLAKKKMIDKRRKTLLSEYQGTKRSGTFEDTRLGEADSKLSTDEKMFMRYAAERKRSYEQKVSNEQWQANDDEELIIKGHSKKSADYSYGGMSEQAVAEVHFGQGGEGSAREDWRDHLDQIISESKQAKYEKHAERYHTSDMVDELDEDWSNLRGAILAAGAPLPPEATKPPTSDNQQADIFDKVVNELRFEQCPDHHKIIEAQRTVVANERKRQLFEEETEAQMNIVFATQDKKLPVHISADALDEDIAVIMKQAAKKKAIKAGSSSYVEAEEPQIRIRGSAADSDMISLGINGANILNDLQQLRVKYNPELHPDNKEKFVSHFVKYLKHTFSASESVEQPFISSLLSNLNDAISMLVELVRTYLPYAETALRSAISSHLRVFCQPTETPSLPQIGHCYCLLKVVAAIFPTSDAFHPVSTPAFSLLAATLRTLATTLSSPSFQTTGSDQLSMICLVLAFMDLGISFVSRSRRYFPEIILCFVYAFETLFALKDSSTLSKSNEDCLFSKRPCSHSVDKLLDQILETANTICNLWADIPGNQVFFKDIVSCLRKLDNNSKEVNDVLESFAKCVSKPLVPMKAKGNRAEEVKELPSFLPLISVDKGVKHKKSELAAVKTTRLKRQIRKEYRHTVRELRRDNEFLARQDLTERIAEDEQRERKTKRIIGQLAMQEGECRKFSK